MFDLEQAVILWRKTLLKNPAMEDGYIKELEIHLRDEIESLVESGMDEQEAFSRAVETVGNADDIGAEFFKTDTRRLSGRPFWEYKNFIPALVWNYVKVALRKIRKQKGFSFINIAGLTVSMASCILILLWVNDELSYDRFHSKSNRIFRVIAEDTSGGNNMFSSGVPSPIGPTLVALYPEVQDYVRVQSGWSNWHLHLDDKSFMDEKLAAVGPEFFKMFDFPFIHGDPESAFPNRYSVVLTESLARKCFGNMDPVGKRMKMMQTDMVVTGVIEDIPPNSHIQFDYAFPAFNMTEWRESQLESWTYTQFATYLLLRDKNDAKVLEGKIRDIVKDYVPESHLRLSLQSLKDVHLHSAHINNWETVYPDKGNVVNVVIFSLVALCILLIACINFMNLTTARYSSRSREVGLRKVAGALRSDLFKQFMGEAGVFSLIALMAAVLLAGVLLPLFNGVTGKHFSMMSSGNIRVIFGLFGLALFTGFLSGSYPALFLSSFQPVQILKGRGMRSGSGVGLRRMLVVIQFALTGVLVVFTSVIYSQLHYVQNKDLGFDPGNVISFGGRGGFRRNYEAVKEELLQNPDILYISRGFPPSEGIRQSTDISWEGKDPSLEVLMYGDEGDYDFEKTFGLRMIEGRFYAKNRPSDRNNFVVNESAVRVMGMDSPLGKRISWRGRSGTIIGVVQDFHGGSLHNPIQPKIIEYGRGFFIFIKFKEGKTAEVLAYLEQEWRKLVKDYPFRYRFIDEQIENQYLADRKTGKIFQYFTSLALFVACLGLFGLTAFSTEQRTKEIGIRKVLGAGTMGILFLLVRGFVKWVMVANVIAWPVAAFIARKWLQSFSYRIPLGWEIFLFSFLTVFLLSVITVSYQTIKAASGNPVESLRYE